MLPLCSQAGVTQFSNLTSCQWSYKRHCCFIFYGKNRITGLLWERQKILIFTLLSGIKIKCLKLLKSCIVIILCKFLVFTKCSFHNKMNISFTTKELQTEIFIISIILNLKLNFHDVFMLTFYLVSLRLILNLKLLCPNFVTCLNFVT